MVGYGGTLGSVGDLSKLCKEGLLDEALQAVELLVRRGFPISKNIIRCLLEGCIEKKDLAAGRRVQSLMVSSGFDSIAVLGDYLIRLFASCGRSIEANQVFYKVAKPSVYTWSAIISANAKLGQGERALKLYHKMQQSSVKSNKYIYIAVLRACAMTAALTQGRLIHDQIIESGLESDVVIGNTLVDMYAKCGSLEQARKVFDKLRDRDAVSWGTMIAGYALHGHGLPALGLFEKMQREGIEPDKFTFSSILKACGNIGAIEQGRLIHNQIAKSGLELDVVVGNTLVDMYAKCGCLEEARKVFDKLPNRNVVTWGALIAGYARYGNCRLAGQCLEDMQRQGLKPDDVIFTSILAACSHAGLVDEGRQYFKSMKEDHGITPNIRHYSCMVDLLGRAGCLSEAEDLLQTIQSDSIGWRSLLTACRTYGNVELGRRCFDQVVRLDPNKAAAYVLMSNIYADAHMWEDADKIQEMRKCAGVWKKPGRAWIEVNNKVHEFIVGDKSHPQSDEIYDKLKMLSKRMKEEGYMPQLDLVLQPMSDKDKEDALCGHCEKLAIAFGLISTPRGTTIRATKNLRVCTDCHNATKIISKIESREIIIRDSYRVHHFKDGACSCGDYY